MVYKFTIKKPWLFDRPLPRGVKKSALQGVMRIGIYAGQYHDSETGLHYNWHRYYDPKTGRYLTPDPIGLDGGINLYTYVDNDPINWIDPLGLIKGEMWEHYFLDPENPLSGVGGGYGGTGTYRLRFRLRSSQSCPGPQRRVSGPPGRISIKKYLEKRWDKATFGTTRKSIEFHFEYHVERHGKGLSKVQYTQRAMKAFENEAATKIKTTDLLGRPAVKVISH